MPNTIKKQLEKLKSSNGREFIKAEKVYAAGGCQILALTKQGWDVLINEFNHEDTEIKIRPEVEEKIQKSWEEEMLETVAKDERLDFSSSGKAQFLKELEAMREE